MLYRSVKRCELLIERALHKCLLLLLYYIKKKHFHPHDPLTHSSVGLYIAGSLSGLVSGQGHSGFGGGGVESCHVLL